ncbi:MAG: alpha/beta fold hydrolase [Comamonadaceae bacterium]|nr:MAG: alpha/beta fold hydrolase [Comamonadaceae bacterium]
MPQLNFVKEGKGPIIVLSHALGSDLHMWDEVAAGLLPRFTVLRYDHRGHGRSERVAGPYTIAGLAEDAAALIAEQARRPVHFVGISMGGMVAQALAVRFPQMISSIVVANSANFYEGAARTGFKSRVNAVREGGLAAIADGTMERWFTPECRADETNGGMKRVAKARATLEATDKDAWIASADAVAAIDFRSSNGLIHCPALVVAGKRDESTPVAMSSAIALAISGAQLRVLDAAHLSAMEQPLSFGKLVSDFVETVLAPVNT